ncbi:uncharacterized protein UHOD_20811 [Ustilago sp. UG-2017b]|nr:uncharacterized protein UHOD_20811 [Ustilago sp. UG-2017b]
MNASFAESTAPPSCRVRTLGAPSTSTSVGRPVLPAETFCVWHSGFPDSHWPDLYQIAFLHTSKISAIGVCCKS